MDRFWCFWYLLAWLQLPPVLILGWLTPSPRTRFGPALVFVAMYLSQPQLLLMLSLGWGTISPCGAGGCWEGPRKTEVFFNSHILKMKSSVDLNKLWITISPLYPKPSWLISCQHLDISANYPLLPLMLEGNDTDSMLRIRWGLSKSNFPYQGKV